MIYLVIAAAVILGEPTLIPPDDCIRVRKIEVAKPHPVKRVLVHKRLFRVEPKPVEEECEHPAPTVTTFFPPAEEPPDGNYTPVPVAVLGPPDVPMRDMPGVEGVECGCFGAGAVLPAWGPVGAVPWASGFVVAPVAFAAPVSEPVTSYLLLAGLGALGFIRSRRSA